MNLDIVSIAVVGFFPRAGVRRPRAMHVSCTAAEAQMRNLCIGHDSSRDGLPKPLRLRDDHKS